MYAKNGKSNIPISSESLGDTCNTNNDVKNQKTRFARLISKNDKLKNLYFLSPVKLYALRLSNDTSIVIITNTNANIES